MWKMPPSIDTTTISAEIALSAISKDPYGMLYKKFINSGLGITSINTSLSSYRDYSMATLQISNNYENNSYAIMQEALAFLENNIVNITQNEFDVAKQNFINNTKNIFSNPTNLGMIASESEVQGDWKLFFKKIEDEKNATLEEAKKTLTLYLAPQNRNGAYLTTNK